MVLAAGSRAGSGAFGIFLFPAIPTLIVELIIFFIVLGVISKFVVPPIRRVLQERASMLDKTTEDNQAASEAFAAAETRYQEALAEARSEAAQIREEARAEGQRILDDIRERTQAEAAEVIEQGTRELNQAREQVLSSLRGDVGTLATTLASRVLGEDVASSPGYSDDLAHALAEAEKASGEGALRDRR
jgi:F-type H+-transporting ATPase subunit b